MPNTAKKNNLTIQSAENLSADEIFAFLRRVFPDWPERRISAWITARMVPDHTLALLEDGKIVSLLSYSDHVFTMNQKKYHGLVLDLAATEPSLQNRGYFKTLFSMAMPVFKAQGIVMGAYNMPFLQKLQFDAFDSMQSGILKEKRRMPGNFQHVVTYRGQFDLYELYQNFLANFDGSFVLSKEDFDNWLEFCRQSGLDLLVSLDSNGAPNGLAILENERNRQLAKVILYHDLSALFNLIASLQRKGSEISLQVGSGEDLSQLFSIDLQPAGRFYIHALHPEMHERLGIEGSLINHLSHLKEYSWNGSIAL